jgi:hypothetical protein
MPPSSDPEQIVELGPGGTPPVSVGPIVVSAGIDLTRTVRAIESRWIEDDRAGAIPMTVIYQ